VTIPVLIGMVHLRPLPGSPAYDGNFDEVLSQAAGDASTLAEAGFDAVMVENFGDAPFFADDAPKVTIAAITTAVNAVYDASRLPIGVNVLRNDGLGALSVAAATPATFIRINVLSGSMFTDQGPIVGRAAEVARLRSAICPHVKIMADVFVKHATPPSGLTLTDATNDLVERAGADAIVVSGAGTGSETSLDDVKTVASLSHLPVLIGSGVNATTVSDFLSVADGVIVGTDAKTDGISTNPVNIARATALVAAATTS
jgi:membrane complex biogenesis BtpA family protein